MYSDIIKPILLDAKRVYERDGLVATLKRIPTGVKKLYSGVYVNIFGSETRYEQRSKNSLIEGGYTEPGPSGKLSAKLIHKHAPTNPAVLEVGCNAGRNLHQCFESGLKELAGNDINPDAIELFKETFPDAFECTETYVGPAQDVLREIDPDAFDVVFTNAVLQHIHTDTETLFDDLSRVTSLLIITEADSEFEKDIHTNWEWEYRDYKDIFQKRGFQCIERHTPDDDTEYGKLLRQYDENGRYTTNVLRKE